MHAAFLGDVVEELQKGPFELQIAWAEDVGGEPGERPAKTSRVESFPQSPGDLGERLFSGLRHLSQTFSRVAAIGSDHPELRAATVADATPCWPAPVSAMMRVLPMRRARRI